MAVYQLNTRIVDDPQQFGRDVGNLIEHFLSWGAPRPTIAISTGRLRFTTNFTIPADQIAHLNLTVITP